MMMSVFANTILCCNAFHPYCLTPDYLPLDVTAVTGVLPEALKKEFWEIQFYSCLREVNEQIYVTSLMSNLD